MTSFCMTSLHVDLNEAAKCVDIIPLTLLACVPDSRKINYYLFFPHGVWNTGYHIASLFIVHSHTRTKYKMATIFGLTYKINRPIYESSRHENLERTDDWCSAVAKVAF